MDSYLIRGEEVADSARPGGHGKYTAISAIMEHRR
jgi:hypothetical protein